MSETLVLLPLERLCPFPLITVFSVESPQIYRPLNELVHAFFSMFLRVCVCEPIHVHCAKTPILEAIFSHLLVPFSRRLLSPAITRTRNDARVMISSVSDVNYS